MRQAILKDPQLINALLLSLLIHLSIFLGIALMKTEDPLRYPVLFVRLLSSEIISQGGTEIKVSTVTSPQGGLSAGAERTSREEVLAPLDNERGTHEGKITQDIKSAPSFIEISPSEPQIVFSPAEPLQERSGAQALNADDLNPSGTLGVLQVQAGFGSAGGPSFLKFIEPEYPELARRLGMEGRVVLRLYIDERGILTDVEVIKKAGYGFDEAALRAVRASRFRPAVRDGMAVPSVAILPVRFVLKDKK